MFLMGHKKLQVELIKMISHCTDFYLYKSCTFNAIVRKISIIIVQTMGYQIYIVIASLIIVKLILRIISMCFD
jgi:hypothetical protein